jgi:hypothetical protein
MQVLSSTQGEKPDRGGASNCIEKFHFSRTKKSTDMYLKWPTLSSGRNRKLIGTSGVE